MPATSVGFQLSGKPAESARAARPPRQRQRATCAVGISECEQSCLRAMPARIQVGVVFGLMSRRSRRRQYRGLVHPGGASIRLARMQVTWTLLTNDGPGVANG